MPSPFLITHALLAVEPDPSGTGPLALILAIVALVLAGLALFLAWHARNRANNAVQEAGEARARAAQGGAANPEALAGVERVWTTKLAALEARLSGGPRPLPPSREREAERAPDPGLGARLEELERVVAGLSVTMKEVRRSAPAAPAAASPAREPHDIAWPACLSAETPAMNDVRQTLAVALKSRDRSAQDLLERLRHADQWPSRKPGASELATALTDISSLLLAALRRGAAVAPLDCSLLSDRVLATLRPLWKPFQPQLDCRSFFPGATFDPDWMDDHTRAGLQRPVISEMLSWAVFEKNGAERRILAKARVTAE